MQIQYQISEDDFVSAGKLAMRKRSKFSRFGMYIWPAFGLFVNHWRIDCRHFKE
jgi:hypothetical protein